MTRRFTGRHMAIVMGLFFGTVIAVNLTMAVLASRTFGGTVVDNSYVASQNFNTWLEAARAQEALGWTMAVTLDPKRQAAVTLDAGTAPIEGARVTAVARHPLGRAPDVALAFDEVAPGRFVSQRALPAGRWYVAVEAAQGAASMQAIEELR